MQLDQVEMLRPPHNMQELPLVEHRLNASTTATHYVIYAQIYLILHAVLPTTLFREGTSPQRGRTHQKLCNRYAVRKKQAL